MEARHWAHEFLRLRRADVKERHRAGASGVEITRSLSDAMDSLLRTLYAAVVKIPDSFIPQPSGLMALGGYGRRELSPASDVDLLFLHTGKMTPYIETLAKRILYTLWDIGLDVGHAIRNVKECVALSRKDPRVKSSLIDARLLCGDEALYREFEKALTTQILEKGGKRFIKEKLAELQARHKKCGGSVYILEPYIKDGVGGLRDIHAALWIAKARYKITGWNELRVKGVITARELALLSGAQDFLLRVRNELHFQAGKHQDQLSFELQEAISRALGFRDTHRGRAVEAFMKVYYLHTACVWQITAQLIQRMLKAERSRHEAVAKGREIREGVRLRRRILSIDRPAMLRKEPGNLIALFADAQRRGAEFSDTTKESIRQNLHLINDSFRRSAAANQHFFRILKWKERVYEALVDMHRLRVLDRFIPEFGQLLCLVQHDLYHIYTVDEHSLVGIRELERLKEGHYKEDFLLLTQVAREVEKIEILYLGMMFHDIGKGHGKGHSQIGAEMVRRIARRMHLNQDDTDELVFLVLNHLLMSHLAQRRDTEDEKLVREFAAQVGTRERLRKLYLLTFADIKAVGPEVWNRWKGSLLSELYLRTLEILDRGEAVVEDREGRVRRIRARVSRKLGPELSARAGRKLMKLCPDAYFLTTPEDDIPWHLALMARFRKQVYLTEVRHYSEKEYSEFAICTLDRPGLFSQIAGVLASHNLDILSARITTRTDHLAFDVFRISHAGRPEAILQQSLWDRVRRDLERVLVGDAEVEKLVEAAKRPTLLKKPTVRWVPTEVLIDNEVSDRFTVLDVYTRDRVGVLYAMTHALHRLEVSIHLAKISTNVNQIADVFYITDVEGHKIRSTPQLDRIKQTLTDLLVEEPPPPLPDSAQGRAESSSGPPADGLLEKRA